MTKKYILTGGPGSGKSTILLELERRGECIIREAAEDVIKREQANGVERPWEDPEFQRSVLRLQVQRENQIPTYIKRAFIDRGILDGLAYTEPGSEVGREIQRESRRYEGVFLIENLGNTQKTQVRREDHVDALELEAKFKEIYLMAGYKIPRIPADKVRDRADLIMWILDGEEK